MRKAFAFLMLVAIANLAFLSASFADVPMIVTYQGELTDSNGDPVNGVHTTAFSLYESPEGGEPLWSESQEVEYTEGLFTVWLGYNTAFPDEIFGAQLWLGINVDDQGELSPLIPLTSSAFSIRAKYVDLLTEENIQQFWALAVSMADADGDGYIKVSQGGNDCDDFNPDIHPGADEICDGVDNDCDGTTDNNAVDCAEGFICINAECVIADADGDGYNVDVDCDDNNPDVYPGAPELCDGLDNDCDGTIDNGADNYCPTGQVCIDGACVFVDADGDGYPSDIDCDDNDPNVYPGAPEYCNGIDDDCDGSIDEDLAQPCYTGPPGSEGVGECHSGTQICIDGVWGECEGEQTPEPEICDGLDNDCNGSVDDADNDSDGFTVCDDCDDNDPNVYPGAPEFCDGVDRNCNGIIYEDMDSDGSPCNLDCDDNDPNRYPGAPEFCDGVDRNCNGIIFEDMDFDGWPCNLDCDDNDPNTYPGAPEICGDFIDNNCDGTVDEGCP